MKIAKYLDKALEYLSILALVIMISLVFFNSVLRYFFDSGIAFSEEFSRICFVYMIFFGIILVAKDKAHLTVDIIISALPEQYRKIVLIVANICVLIAMIFYSLWCITTDVFDLYSTNASYRYIFIFFYI